MLKHISRALKDGCNYHLGGSHTERAAPRRAAPRLEQPEVSHTRRAQFILINYLKCVVTVVSW